MSIELRGRICPSCGGCGIEDNADIEDNAQIPDCEECGGVGYIEQARYKPKKIPNKD
jgi:DnaJ-class molecular chaperone